MEKPDKTESNIKFPKDDFYCVKLRILWKYTISAPLSFWAICTYLFFEYVRPQSSYPAIDVLPFGQIAIIAAFSAYFFDPNRKWVRNSTNTLLSMFAVTIILSSITAYYPQESLANWMMFTQWFIVYFLIINIVTTERRFFLFYLSFLLYSFKMTQHGFLSWAQRGFSFAGWGVTGAPGWFHNSGEFGIQICVFLPLSICFIVALKSYWGFTKYVFFLLFPFTALTSAIATSSRGALVGVASTLLWLTMKSRYKVKAIILVVLTGIAVYYTIPPESMVRFYEAGEDETSITRKIRWQDGIDMMNNHPILGIGYANWLHYYPNHYDRIEPGRENPYGLPHNVFIDAGAELGYTGLSIYIFLIISTLINNYNTRRFAEQSSNTFIYWTALGLDAAMIGFLVSGSFVSVLYYPYFWINLAMTVALNHVAQRDSRLK